MAKNIIGIFHEKCSVKLHKRQNNLFNVSGDHNVNNNVSMKSVQMLWEHQHAIFTRYS